MVLELPRSLPADLGAADSDGAARQASVARHRQHTRQNKARHHRTTPIPTHPASKQATIKAGQGCSLFAGLVSWLSQRRLGLCSAGILGRPLERLRLHSGEGVRARLCLPLPPLLVAPLRRVNLYWHLPASPPSHGMAV